MNIFKLKYISFVLVLSLLSIITISCSKNSNGSTSFSQLVAQSEKYNGKTITMEAYYFSGFEISVLSEALGPSTYNAQRIVPTGTLVWVAGGISEDIYNKLYIQTDTPSGYAEHIGKLKVTGKFETGGQYGHLNAYEYQITVTSAVLLEWTPPTSAIDTGKTSLTGINITATNPIDYRNDFQFNAQNIAGGFIPE